MTQAACKTRRRNRPQLARRYIERVDQPEPVHLALDRNLAPGKREGSKHRVLSRAKYVAKWARRVPCADSSHSGQAAPSRSRTVRINSPPAAAHEAISGDRWQSCSRQACASAGDAGSHHAIDRGETRSKAARHFTAAHQGADVAHIDCALRV